MRCFFVLVLSVAAGGVQADAAERIEYRIPSGFTYSFDNVTDSTSVLDVGSGGQSMTFEQRHRQHIHGSVEVLASSDGVPTRLRIRFDPSSGSQTTSNGATQEIPFGLAGQTIEVAVQNERIVSITDENGREASLDEQTRSVVAEIAIAEQAVLPDGPVRAGDEWVADLSREDRPVTPMLTLTVAGFGEQGGRRIAKLDADGTLVGTQQGMNMDGKVSGPIILDLETGVPLSSRLSGSIAVNGTLEQNGMSTAITGSQYVTISSTNEVGTPPVARAGPTERDATPAAGGSTPTGDDPRLVGMFAGEALAGGGGSGVYVNTQLVYVLNADGSLYYGAQSHFNASERDYNGNLRWTATGNTDGSVESGRWSAKAGFLTIRWNSGQQSLFAYGFEPDGSLVLRDPTTRKLINFYRRVR